MTEFLAANWAGCWAPCSGFARLNAEVAIPFEQTEQQVVGSAIHSSVARYCLEGIEDAYTDEFGKPFYDMVHAETCGFETALTADWLAEGYQIRIDGWNFVNGVLSVYELKTGYTPVSAVNNPTLVIYALTLAETLRPTTVELVVCQPRDYTGSTSRFTLGADLAEYAAWIKQRYQQAVIGREFHAGAHCGYCPNRVACPALRGSVGVSLDFAFGYRSEVPSPGEIGSEITLLRLMSERIKDRLSGLEQLAEHRIRKGVPVPGWELRANMSTRRWRSPEAAEYLMRSLGITPKEDKLITPAEAERRGMSKDLTQELTERKELSPKLTPVK